MPRSERASRYPRPSLLPPHLAPAEQRWLASRFLGHCPTAAPVPVLLAACAGVPLRSAGLRASKPCADRASSPGELPQLLHECAGRVPGREPPPGPREGRSGLSLCVRAVLGPPAACAAVTVPGDGSCQTQYARALCTLRARRVGVCGAGGSAGTRREQGSNTKPPRAPSAACA